MAFTLIVEDGTGLPTANAFASNAEVTALLAAHPFASAWDTATNQDQCIAEATAWLSRLRWQGRQTVIGTQALAWPRAWVPQPDRGTQATGQPFIYDYLYCRNGPTTGDKFRNLILYFPNIREDVWISKNPDDPSRKSSNWYLTANAHVFSDGWSLLR